MKYGTKIVYGIDPQVLANMRHIDALRACLVGARKQINHFTYSAPKMTRWSNRRKNIIAYIRKAENWVYSKLEEIENG